MYHVIRDINIYREYMCLDIKKIKSNKIMKDSLKLFLYETDA